MRITSIKSRFNNAHENMIHAVVAFAYRDENVKVTESIPAFASIIKELAVNMEKLAVVQGSVNNSVKGITVKKREVRNGLIEMGAGIMQATYAMAMKTANAELAAKMKTAKGRLTKLKDTVLTATMEAAIGNVRNYITALINYGITEETVERWATQCELFTEMKSLPKTAHDALDVMRNKRQDILKRCMILLYEEADMVSKLFKNNNLDYYRSFLKARKLQPFIRHTKLRVTITNKDGVGTPMVMVQQDGTSNFARTDAEGKATLYVQLNKSVDGGSVYSFMLRKDTMEIKTGLIEIKKGRTVSRRFMMGGKGFVLPKEKIFEDLVV